MAPRKLTGASISSSPDSRAARIGHPVDLAVLAVADDVDAGVGLLPHHLRDRARDARVEGAAVVGLAQLLVVEQRDQIGRARQAAGVGGEDAAVAALHHSTFRLSFLISADQRVMSRSTIAAYSSGVLDTASPPSAAMRLLHLRLAMRDPHRLR